MNFIIADTFTRSLVRLDGQSQGLVKQAAFEFQLNPAQPGAQFHRLDRAKDKNFWSFRVNSDLRIIVHRNDDSLMLCYADHHDPAYDWAERRRLEVHPQTGAAQLVELVERTEEVVQHVFRRVEQEAPLFERYESDYLSALGVPAEWLDAVKVVGETGLMELIDHLPAEAAERLLELASGKPVPRPVVVSAGSPFSHPDAQRRFRVVDSQRELQQALEAPWEQWIIFLHPTQRSVVERTYNGPARVSGSAGTGKSVVALHRVAWLARGQSGARVLLTSFSKTLASRLAYSADLLMGQESLERKRVVISHLHRVALDIWRKRMGQSFVALDSRELDRRLEGAGRQMGAAYSTAFLRAEWDAVVDVAGIDSWEMYKAASRAGRGTALGAKQRRVLWSVFEAVLEETRRTGRLTWNGLCLETARLINASGERPFDHIVVDECQDFGPAELKLLRALVAPGKDDLFLCGDAGQRIFRRGSSWASAGIQVRGRSSRLKVNYRTTEQIRRFSDRLLPDSLDEGDGELEERSTVSLLNGPAPQVIGFSSSSEEIGGVAAWMKSLLNEGYLPRDMALFTRTDGLMKERAEAAVNACGLPVTALNDDPSPSAEAVSVGTMHRAKGLEFKAVVVMGCDANQLPHAYSLSQLEDDADCEAFVEHERQLLYVASTRARERLLVTYTGSASSFLG